MKYVPGKTSTPTSRLSPFLNAGAALAGAASNPAPTTAAPAAPPSSLNIFLPYPPRKPLIPSTSNPDRFVNDLFRRSQRSAGLRGGGRAVARRSSVVAAARVDLIHLETINTGDAQTPP